MRIPILCLCLLLGSASGANAQAFKDFAPDMALKNLQNELEQRRQQNQESKRPHFSAAAKSQASLLILNWMIANQEQSLPPGNMMDALTQQAERSIDAAGISNSRNLEIDFMLFANREFKTLQAKWHATRGDASAEKALSDQTWRSFKQSYGIDLRDVTLDDFLN